VQVVLVRCLGFKEMLDAPNIRRSGKKHSKHATSSGSIASSSSPLQAGSQLTLPVIGRGAPGRTSNHRDDTAPPSGLPGGQKAAKIRRALARFNILPFSSTNR